MKSEFAVRFEMQGNIAMVTLAAATTANAIDLPFSRQFLDAIYQVEASSPRVVILQSSGEHFCFGGDLKQMQAQGNQIGPYLHELTSTLHTAIGHLSRLPAPVLVAAQGAVAGAGLGLVLAADLAIAAETARFSPAYMGVGLTPDAGCSFLLPRAIGSKRAMEMLLSNRTLSAREALDWGLINRIVPPQELTDAALAWARQLADGSLTAQGALKLLLTESEPGFESQLARESRTIAQVGAGGEASEGIAAFLQKRKPHFGMQHPD